jgi:hypothetical protein
MGLILCVPGVGANAVRPARDGDAAGHIDAYEQQAWWQKRTT